MQVLLKCQMLAWFSLNTEMWSLIPCPLSDPSSVSASCRQVAQLISLYLEHDFGSQGQEASLRSAGWEPSCCHRLCHTPAAVKGSALLGVLHHGLLQQFGGNEGSSSTAKALLTYSASVGGS